MAKPPRSTTTRPPRVRPGSRPRNSLAEKPASASQRLRQRSAKTGAAPETEAETALVTVVEAAAEAPVETFAQPTDEAPEISVGTEPATDASPRATATSPDVPADGTPAEAAPAEAVSASPRNGGADPRAPRSPRQNLRENHGAVGRPLQRRLPPLRRMPQSKFLLSPQQSGAVARPGRLPGHRAARLTPTPPRQPRPLHQPTRLRCCHTIHHNAQAARSQAERKGADAQEIVSVSGRIASGRDPCHDGIILGAGFTHSNVSCRDRPGLNLCSRSRGIGDDDCDHADGSGRRRFSEGGRAGEGCGCVAADACAGFGAGRPDPDGGGAGGGDGPADLTRLGASLQRGRACRPDEPGRRPWPPAQADRGAGGHIRGVGP